VTARLVAAFGTSHSPALASPAEDMAGHARRDEQYAHHLDLDGNRITYQELLRKRAASFQEEITPAKIRERIAACERHLGRLARSITDAKLDALVIVGCSTCLRARPSTGSAPVRSTTSLRRRANTRSRQRSLCISSNRSFPTNSTFHSERACRGSAAKATPSRPRRCYALGVAVRRAIEQFASDQRIGIIASGGLSHFTVDETLDRMVLDSCQAGDEEALASIPLAKLNSGNSEIRNWIVMGFAALG
jgi:hypothetical protein